MKVIISWKFDDTYRKEDNTENPIVRDQPPFFIECNG